MRERFPRSQVFADRRLHRLGDEDTTAIEDSQLGTLSVWLDDVRPAPAGWIWVKTAWEAIELILSGDVAEISLDHDLGDDELNGTGYDVAKKLEELAYLDPDFPQPGVSIHSKNPVGASNIRATLDSIKRMKSSQ
jgi:hypothetical protein